MTYLQVDYFLHVAATKSISKSAADLYVSAPAVSKQISLMEQELGLTLFIRGARGMELTPEGQIMFDYYLNQKNSLSLALQKARKLDSSHTNTLHIGVMSGWAIHPQIKALQQSLRNSAVPTELTAHSVFDPGNPERLEKGIFDAALCIGDDLFTIALSTGVRMIPLAKIRKMILFSSRLPIAQKENLTIQDLAGLPLLSFTPALRPNAQYDNLRLCNNLDFSPDLILCDSLDDAFFRTALGDGFMIGDEWLTQKNLPEFSSLILDDLHAIYLVWSEHNQNPALPLLARYCEATDWTIN